MELRSDSLHPECEAVLEHVEETIKPPSRVLSVEGTRRLSEQFFGSDEPIEQVGTTRDLLLPGPDGNDLSVRVYVPEGEGTFPILVWIHGGGFVLGGLESHDPTCRLLTNATEYVVVSVDYRLAPENPFPAALRDCYSAVQWVAENGETIRGDPERIALGGQSSGGNLTAATTLMARDEGVDAVDYQVLVYPVTDFVGEHDSMEENAEGYYLSRATSEWYHGQYLEHNLDARHPYASPLLAPDFGDLPPATVVTAGFDPLRDEGIEYAERLEAADIPTEHRHHPDMIHGFFSLHQDPAICRGREAINNVAEDLHEELGR
jgi:acetyl esterase